ncbi:AraC family transcriptional regulator [Yoonia sp. I 8.24]|uniref:helix-turn-helix domain-containing protein n=1 Tax=Yoonia sp. I 8.24 TaxID=1537229 RepID=UPI001EE100C6|nr:AraC family transcriptional regulator [Yoonia sp. I 8.24]MCG3268797.1 helix-turn-helix transcriptional regulator [Yoonia sp. I 8.24]
MPKPPNPDIYRPMELPTSIRPYVRRALVADSNQSVDMEVSVRATGYHYFGWVWRGIWQGEVNGKTLFSSDNDGTLHLTGQVKQGDVIARMKRDIGQIFLEFTALGHFQLFGITGKKMVENAVDPQMLNPALARHFTTLCDAGDISAKARLALLADVFSELPKWETPNGLVAAIAQMEAADGDIRISALVDDLDLAERQFRTQFETLVGLSPKTFCKTLQINRAFSQVLMNNGGDLAGIAAEAGFSDQAHFTRSFSKFLGQAPKRYLNDVETTLKRFVGQSRA